MVYAGAKAEDGSFWLANYRLKRTASGGSAGWGSEIADKGEWIRGHYEHWLLESRAFPPKNWDFQAVCRLRTGA